MIKFNFMSRISILVIILCASLTALYLKNAQAKNFNGFDLTQLNIDQSEVFSGGPGRDGIPSIDNPKFIHPSKVNFLHDDDMVMSFSNGKTTKAYPLRILIWHEIVNDSINNQSIAVTYCPLCGSGMVFDRVINGKERSFGVSGLLYRSDVLMYDRDTLSLWSQLGMKGVSKDAIGKKLTWLPSKQLTWQAWRDKYPNGQVLSTDTGFNRQYANQAYASYFNSPNAMFPVPKFRNELQDKSKVLGIIIDGTAKAYPIKYLQHNNDISDSIGTSKITIKYDNNKKQAIAKDLEGNAIASVIVYWFAWQGFYPDTLLLQQ